MPPDRIIHSVNIFINQELGPAREAVRGVVRFAGEQVDESLELLCPSPIGWPETLTMHGAIAWPNKPADLDFLRKLEVPVVCLESWPEAPEFSQIHFDNAGAGRQIAAYFLDRGIKHFAAYCRDPWQAYSRERLRGFHEKLKENGLDCAVFDASEHGDWEAFRQRALSWLDSLPKPVGILADTDAGGYNVIMLARHLELQIPDQIAVISVGGDELICEMSRPELSSLKLPCMDAGYLAAQMLKNLLDGKEQFPRVIKLQTSHLIERASSNTLSVGDSEVSQALRYIHENATRPIGIPDIMSVVGISRRSLELRFKKMIGHTLQQAILKARLHRAKKLLSETDLPIGQVAERSGFGSGAQLCHQFREELGLTPKAYRHHTRSQ